MATLVPVSRRKPISPAGRNEAIKAEPADKRAKKKATEEFVSAPKTEKKKEPPLVDSGNDKPSGYAVAKAKGKAQVVSVLRAVRERVRALPEVKV
jgi:hypothetical protein